MSSYLSASAVDALVAAGNFFFVRGYPCTLGHHHVQVLSEVSVVRKQIDRLNVLLPILEGSWRVLPYIVAIEGHAAVLVSQTGGLLDRAEAFPHGKFALLRIATERVAEKVANPEGRKDLYQAPEQSTTPLGSLLVQLNTNEESIRDILPALAMHGGGEIHIQLRDQFGSSRPISLPPTEAVRKPTSTTTKKGFSARVVGSVPVYNYLVTEEGHFIDVRDRDVSEFEIGKVYFFAEVAQRKPFSKALRHATCDLKEQGEIFEDDPQS